MFRRPSTRTLIIAALAVVSVPVLVILGLPEDKPVYIPFPEKLEYRVQLGDGEENRVVQYYPDGHTPMYAVVEHKNGQLSEFWYWETGKLKEAKIRSIEVDGARQLLRHAHIEPDGVTYNFDVEYFADGVKSKETRLVSENETLRNYFHPRSGNLHKAQTLTRVESGWILDTETTYFNEGPVESKFVRLDDGATKRDVFSLSGKLVSVHTLNKSGVTYKEVDFFDDEKTPRRVVEQTRKNTVLTRLRMDGTTEVKITFAGPVGEGIMIYDEFGADGESNTLHQYFMFREGRYRIYTYELFNDDGAEIRSVYFSSISGILQSETIRDPDNSKNWVHKSYDENGFLTVAKVFKNGNKVEETTHTPDENLRHGPVEDEHLKVPDYVAPPQVIPYDPPRSPHG